MNIQVLYSSKLKECMNEPISPLSSLIVDDVKSIDENQLTMILTPYIRFDKEGKINLMPAFNQMKSNDLKIQILLLSSKATSIILNDQSAEGLSPIEIMAFQVMPEGSVKSSLKKLFDNHRIKKNKGNKYYVPGYRLTDVENELKG